MMAETWPCPSCGGLLALVVKPLARPVSVAGAQMKLAVDDWPFLVCSCGFEEAGKCGTPGGDG